MKIRTFLIPVSLIVLFALLPSLSQAWGFWAHKRINRIAVFTLPKEMLGFYKSHIDYLTEHAVDADKRRHTDEDEAPRHYIDLEFYCQPPCDSIPLRWKEAVALYTEDSIKEWGSVLWHVQSVYYQLVKAMSEKDKDRILYLSADIGHYIADANVPLHTTENYDGQLTGQKGIHGFWESRLPELYGEEYDYFVGKAEYIDDLPTYIWNHIRQANAAKDSVLQLEAELSKSTPDDKKFTYEQRGSATVRVYSSDYSKAYHDMLNGMVERQLRASIRTVGSLWYSAWVDAGQPKLKDLINPEQTKEQKKNVDQEQKEYESEHDMSK